VPDILLSGHHEQIARWRRKQSLRLTRERRPDLFAKVDVSGKVDAKLLRELEEEEGK
jgi:tRNA (guanine37-N1)-methyltransferase